MTENEITEDSHTEVVNTKRSKLNLLTLVCLCLASALLTGSIILIYQYKQGIPYGLATSLTLAAVFGILIPLVITRIFMHFRRETRYGNYGAFLLCNVLLSLGIGLSIF